MSLLRKFRRDQRGSIPIEYCLLVGLISLAVGEAVATVTPAVERTLTMVSAASAPPVAAPQPGEVTDAGRD